MSPEPTALAAAGFVIVAVAALGGCLSARRRDRLLGAMRGRQGHGMGSRGRARTAQRRSLLDTKLTAPVAALGGALVGRTVGGVLGAIALGIAGGVTPRLLRSRRARRRREAIDEQLADGVASIAAALRAGMSLVQAIGFAADEAAPPLSDALHRIVEREALGVPLDEGVGEWASRDGTSDVRLAAGVLQLYHRVGGEVPSVLDQVAHALRQRRTAERELRSLTAQARLSGAVLGLLPVGFFLFLALVARADMELALRNPAGVAAIAVGLALDGAAFLWIRKLLRVAA